MFASFTYTFSLAARFARWLMFTNMEFLFSKTCITPELLSAIQSVDFVALDSLVQRLQLPLEDGEDSWLRICDLFLRSLLNSVCI